MSYAIDARCTGRVELLWVVEDLQNIGGSEYMTVLFTSLLESAGVHVRLVSPAQSLPVWTERIRQSGAESILAADGPCSATALCEAVHRACGDRLPTAVQFTPIGGACAMWCANTSLAVPVIAWEPTGMSPACTWMPANLREILRRVDGVIVLTESAAAETRNRLGYDGRLAVVPNTIAPPMAGFQPRTALPPVISIVSRLDLEKGVDLAIHSFSLFHQSSPGARLHVWGHGPDEGRLRELVTMLRLTQSVEFRGVFEPFAGVDQVAAETNIAMLASFFEGMPVALMEMAARGVPIVASRNSGTEAVLGADYPWLSKVGDTAAMARHLEILSGSTEAWNATRKRLLAEWHGRFAPQTSITKLTEFYASVAKASPC